MVRFFHGESSSSGGSHHGQGHQSVPFPTTTVLHGNLEIWVQEARNLPRRDRIHQAIVSTLPEGGIVFKLSKRLGAKVKSHMSHIVTIDPYVIVFVAGVVVAKTFVIRNDNNPAWMQHFNFPVAHHAEEVLFVVKGKDAMGSKLIGAVGIPVQQFCSGEKFERDLPIRNATGQTCNPGAVLRLSIQYTPVDKVALYNNGVGAGAPDTYFPLRKGGQVVLYQDARVHDGSLPSLKVDGNISYKHASCWHDIFDAIYQARRLVYIAGWSVYHKVSLIRDTRHGKDCTLGDLLKAKSREGVRVLLLVWDDPTSKSFLGHKTVTNFN